MKSNFESIENIQRMQQEAVRRVHEMQKRAKQSLSVGTQYSEKNKVSKNEIENPKNPDVIEQPENLDLLQNSKYNLENTNSKHQLTKPISKFDPFSSILKDHEKGLILLLILILIDESCDLSLIIALMYLII